jgi:hypothetical protein
LNPVEVEVIHLFGSFHARWDIPAKFRTSWPSAPVIGIGPKPSHVTEILDSLGDGYPSIRVAHGEADILAEQIEKLRQKVSGSCRLLPAEATAAFSKAVLLPSLIADLEKVRDE